MPCLALDGQAWVDPRFGSLVVAACGGRTELYPGEAEPEVIVDPTPLELDCPTRIDTERLPHGFVSDELAVDGGLFVTGDVATWDYSVVAEKCDEIPPRARTLLPTIRATEPGITGLPYNRTVTTRGQSRVQSSREGGFTERARCGALLRRLRA